MKSRDVVGRKIVAIKQDRYYSATAQGVVHDLQWLELDDGSRIMFSALHSGNDDGEPYVDAQCVKPEAEKPDADTGAHVVAADDIRKGRGRCPLCDRKGLHHPGHAGMGSSKVYSLSMCRFCHAGFEAIPGDVPAGRMTTDVVRLTRLSAREWTAKMMHG